MFDLSQNLPKYLRNNFHKNAVLTIDIINQSYYIICNFMVRLFICIVQSLYAHILQCTHYLINVTRVPYGTYGMDMYGCYHKCVL